MIDRGIVERADRWLDSGVADAYKDQPLAQHWARISKVSEEIGEAIAELILWTGQNPRKGTDLTAKGRLYEELADVVMTGILALQHLTKDIDVTESVLERSQAKLRDRIPGDVAVTDWAAEREDVLSRFMAELSKATGDGSKKRQSGAKPPWYEDPAHEGAIFSHLTKWKRGELVDPDSGAHPLVHAAWRCLAIACRESGNIPGLVDGNGLWAGTDPEWDDLTGEGVL